VLGNTANLHWYFLWLAPWLLLYRPRSGRGSLLLGAVAFLGAMTEIQMVAFAPLLFGARRDRRRWPVAIGYLAGCVLQIGATLFNPRGHSSAPLIGVPSLLYGYLINAAMSVWNSNPTAIHDILSHSGAWVAVVAIIPFFAAAAVVLKFGTRRQKQIAVLLLVSSLVLWTLAVEMDPGARYNYASSANWQSIWLSRYGVVPSLMLLAFVPLALTVLRRRYETGVANGSRWRGNERVPWVIGLACILLMATSWMPTTTVRSVGPEWQPEVAAAQEACETAPPQTVMQLSGAPSPNWALELTCRQLQRDRL
jgi:heme/copper-type cytochrome/quinol oxidase subunit 2